MCLHLLKGTLKVSLVAYQATTIQLPMRNTYIKKVSQPVSEENKVSSWSLKAGKKVERGR